MEMLINFKGYLNMKCDKNNEAAQSLAKRLGYKFDERTLTNLIYKKEI